MGMNGTYEGREDDLRDQLDELRERIRSGDLSPGEWDQLDQLVFTVALADLRATRQYATSRAKWPCSGRWRRRRGHKWRGSCT